MTKRLAMLACAGLVAAAAPAMAATYYYVPSDPDLQSRYYVPSTDDTQTYYYVTQGPSYVISEEPAVIVEAPRWTEDQRLTNDVVDVLASDRYLSGRIGVETYDRDVRLSGSVTTPGQVRRAVRDAQGVPGVDHVTSELRPKVGANTSY